MIFFIIFNKIINFLLKQPDFDEKENEGIYVYLVDFF
jgi:hypothetical protein